MSNRPGIYCILNIRTHKRYVGSSADAPKRLYVHGWLLRQGRHHSPQLQRSWDRDGEKAFVFTVIENCAREDLLRREQIWMNALQTCDDRFGYNICTVAGTREGVPQPITVSERMRALHRGKPKSAEHRAKIGAGNLGKKRSDKARAAIAAAVTLQMSDPERRALQAKYGAMAKPYWKNKKLPQETVEKIRAAHQARWEGVQRKPRKSYYKPKPADQHLKRGPKPGTPRHDRRSLTAEQVLAIHDAKKVGATYGELVEKFGLDRSSLHRLLTGKTYKMF